MVAPLIICAVAIFVSGGVLLLERRCMGQIAIVQPMVLCLVAGLIIDRPYLGLWLGVSFQLLSTGQSHYCNWALSAFTCAGTMLCLERNGIDLSIGSPITVIILFISVLVGTITDRIDKHQARMDHDSLKQLNLWRPEETTEPFVRLVHRRVLRGFMISGVQAFIGVVLASTAAVVSSAYLTIPPLATNLIVIGVPSFGVAATISSLVGYRFSGFAAAGFVAFLAVMVAL